MSWRAFLGRRIREVRLNLCASSKSSSGVRKYVNNHYVDIKALNPNLPFLVRAVDDVTPNIVATYDYGVKQFVDVADYSEEQIDDVFKTLVEKGNTLKPKFDKLKELAHQIEIAETANLDSEPLAEEFAKARQDLENCV